jgi:hypothetical protein
MRTIKEFIRDFDGKPYGCMVATVVDMNGVEVVSIGVSLCHIHDKNKWDKKLATEIAMGRAEVVNCKMRMRALKFDNEHVYASHCGDDLERFLQRARAYFQDKPIILPNIEWF